MNKKNIKLVVADDHHLLLKGLVDTLTQHGYETIWSALDGADALKLILEFEPDVALLDIEMPILTGFEVIQKAKEHQLKTRFIILTSHKEKGFVMKSKKFNISGYILKDEPFTEVVNCINAVASGKEYFSRTFDDILSNEISPALEKIKFLSPSERTILRLIAMEKSSKEIGENLTISYRTVQKHRANIIAKLDLSASSDALTTWTMEHKELLSYI